MMLFANSGLAWPRHEPATKEAGKKALEATSGIFKVLAAIEGGAPPSQTNELDLVRYAAEINEAAMAYAKISDDLRGEVIEPLTRSEIEMAAIDNRQYRRYIDGEIHERSYRYDGHLDIGLLYRDLAHRLRRLASAIKTLKTSESSFDLAPQVFQIFDLLGSSIMLARLIATLGRRSNAGN